MEKYIVWHVSTAVGQKSHLNLKNMYKQFNDGLKTFDRDSILKTKFKTDLSMVDYDIVCKRCGKKARINAEDGELCLSCWRIGRRETQRCKKFKPH